METQMKVCRRGHSRPVTQKRCRLCDTSTRRSWNARNKEKVREDFKAWRQANPQYHNDWMREYRKTETGGRLHRERERKRRLDKRYMFVRLCRSYGLEVSDFAWLLHSQGFRCGACRGTVSLEDRQFAVDHCHKTGAVRGILCPGCNLALGQVRDNPEVLMCLYGYLKGWKGAECVRDSNGRLQIWEPK